MGDRGAPSAPVRFHVAVQRSRAIVYALAFAAAVLARAAGVLDFAWRDALLFIALTEASALAFSRAYARGRTHLGPVSLTPLWMAFDVFMITWAVHISGGSASWWFVWYVTNSAAAAFVAGRTGLAAVTAANAVAYVGSLQLLEGPDAVLLAHSVGRLALLYGSAVFALLAVTRERAQRRELKALRRRDAERVAELERVNRELREALDQVDRLHDLLPICSYCKRVRTDRDYWEQVEAYISARSRVRFSHGICPDCYEKHVRPELEEFLRERGRRLDGSER